MLEDFKNHPVVAPIIRGAKMVEHSGHMVPEGGYDMIPKYVFDGCLLAGEAAGLCMNMGYQVRGMDFAVASGQMAAKAAVEALDKGDVSEAGLSSYREMMEFLKLVRVCPAALYKVDGDGAKSFDYAGCLECGTCRIACGGTIVEKWVNPGPTMGVEYRFG